MTIKPTLLIVDDVEANREALIMRLELAGYSDCISVGGGQLHCLFWGFSLL